MEELSDGDLSPESVTLLKSLEKPADQNNTSIHLCCSNRVVTITNASKLSTNTHQLRVYKSVDSDNNSFILKKFSNAEAKLYLKINAPIIFTANIADKICNGTRGVISGLYDDAVVVNVDGKEHRIYRHKFDLSTRTRVATRIQFPLKLAYAISIHRSQGLTLNSAHINCEDMFASQQLYVALSRVKTLSGISLSNFLPHLIQPCNAIVVSFMENEYTDYLQLQDQVATLTSSFLILGNF